MELNMLWFGLIQTIVCFLCYSWGKGDLAKMYHKGYVQGIQDTINYFKTQHEKGN